MNHVYRIVWNHVACTWQAVAESAKGFGKGRPGGRGAQSPQSAPPRFSIKPLLMALSLISAPAWAGPQGGQVVAGNATIQQTGNTTTINQGSNRAAIDWTSFSVGKTESVRFNQPSTSAITLNRVTGTESSQILGSISANGQVFILNPNGVLFGQGAQVNVGGLVASSHGMSNADFMAGNFQLSGNGSGSVINQGTITVPEGGCIALIAPVVKNTGTLNTPQGTVLLAAADAVSLKLQDGSLIGYTLDKGSLQALVDNGGLIHADGGHVVLTAKALDALAKATINHSGIIEAQTVANKNGVVELLGDMQVGEIKLSGKIDASAPNGGDGGFVETSAAKVRVLDGYQISTLATGGKTGIWLIDPRDFTIAASGGDITGAGLSSYLLNNNVMIQSAAGSSVGNGDIYVNDAVSWGVHKLTLSAGRNVNINANLTASGSASLALEYGQSAVASGNTSNYFINNGAKITLPAGQNFSTKLGGDGATTTYTVITSLGTEGSTTGTDLQGMNGNLAGNYALGADIDASGTSTWNGGRGWGPIGQSTTFSGIFAGLGHHINGITISNVIGGNIGFFGSASGLIKDVSLMSSYVTTTAGGYSGILVGLLDSGGKISNSFTDGLIDDLAGINSSTGGIVGAAGANTIIEKSASSATVRGDHAAGGLVGFNFGQILDCSSSGDVTQNSYVAGGLVGINNGNIVRSYSTSKVNGLGIAGGLVGWAGRDALSTIADSYATGSVTASGSVGGLVGYFSGGTISNSHYPIDSVMITINGVVQDNNFVSIGGLKSTQWNDWFVDKLLVANDYFSYKSGRYQINTLGDLISILGFSDANLNFDLNASIFLSPGFYIPYFKGGFYGNNHQLLGLSLDQPQQPMLGMFGFLASDSVITQLGVNGSITGSNYVGGLVGLNSGGVVSNSYAIGSVTGASYVGGGVGLNAGGAITNSYASAHVSGAWDVGGLVGVNASGEVSNSYATSSVSGSWEVGGLAGLNAGGAIRNSYATGSVSGSWEVGGLVGLILGGAISNSYAGGSVTASGGVGGLVGDFSGGTISSSFWDTDSSGQTTSAGGTGLTTAQMKMLANFTSATTANDGVNPGWDFTNIWYIYEGQSYPLLRSFAGGAPNIPPGEAAVPSLPQVYALLQQQKLQDESHAMVKLAESGVRVDGPGVRLPSELLSSGQ